MSLRLSLSAGIVLVGLLPPAVSAQITPSPLPAPEPILRALELSAATVQDLQVPPALGSSFQVDVVLDNQVRTLQLRAYDLRAAGFRLLVDDGDSIHQVPTPPSVTFRGDVAGVPGSVVAASWLQGQMEATIHMASGDWGIEPASRVMEVLPFQTHVVYRKADVVSAGQCGNVEQGKPVVLGGGAAAPSVALKEAEIALDGANPFYRLNGSNVTQTQNAATSIINSVDAIYQRDVTIAYKITTIIVRSTAVYTTTGTGLLNQFQSRWNSQHTSVVRDVAHLFAGNSSSSVAGIAYLGVVCNRNSAYGVTWWQGSLVNRAGVAAHEIGHNFNAPHCDGVNPCYIMCSFLGACNRSVTKFGTSSINIITAFKNSRGCLSNVSTNPPVLTSISPTSVASHYGGTVTLTGNNLDALSSVQIGSTTITQIATSSTTQATFLLPDPFEINTHNVTATNSAGTSNALQLVVTGNNPGVLEAPTFHPKGFTIGYDCYTNRTWNVALFISSSNLPSSLPGLVTLGIGNSFSDLTQVAILLADNAGFASLPLLFPATAPGGTVFWQGIPFTFPLQTPLVPTNVEVVNYF